jgi:hypothetical protein
MTARLSVFHSQANAVLSCIRDRVIHGSAVVDSLAAVPGALPRIADGGFRLDLIGHNEDGFLRFGEEHVDDGGECIEIFSKLRAARVTEVALLGCEVGNTTQSARVPSALSAATGLHVRASVRDLRCLHYGHDGLRASVESAVFGTAPQDVEDARFSLSDFLASHTSEPGRNGVTHPVRVTREQAAELSAVVAVTYQTCCPLHKGIDDTARTLKWFQLEGGGSGRAVEKADGTVVVLATVRENVEVIYEVVENRRRSVRDIIADWR